MTILDIIEKKKNKTELTKEEIFFFINGYTNNEIADYQVSSLLMCMFLNGMNIKETTYLTDAMINSGKTIDLSSIKGVKLDKHSTGGVGDTVSLVLGPIVASCGGIFAKMSGRGLGHTGGTIDKLESIPGFNCFLSDEKFIEIVKKSNIAIIGQTDDLVPADKKLYALRDVTGTVNSIPFISSSIMSKKIATGSDVILLDIKCGSGAFMKTKEDAIELGEWMISIGKGLNKNVSAVITDMNQPLSKMIGNKNEIIEAMETLKGNGDKSFLEVVYTFASLMLVQSKIAKDDQEAIKLIDESIKTGKALNKFFEFVENQGGDSKAIQKEDWWKPKYKFEIKANKSGYFSLKDSVTVGIVAMKLGAGRQRKEDSIDFEAGIEIKKTIGEFVEKDETIIILYSSKEIDPSYVEEIEKIVAIDENKSEIKRVIKTMK